MTGYTHIPVLPEETIEALNISPDGIYVDGTAGGGGHSELIAIRLSDKGRLIAIDQDGEAIEAAGKRLAKYGDRVTIIRNNFRNIKNIMDDLGIREVNGIVLDIGVSSHQLDDPDRGFSYMKDGPLDMRMDRDSSLTAADIVNNCAEDELFRIIKNYGEERYAKQVAKAIVCKRKEKRIETTSELCRIIEDAYPAKAAHAGGSPAMRTFQALRIEVNHELDALNDSLDIMTDLLASKGRLAVISFHSLEDRIVKENFRRNENPCTCPPDFPVCVCGKKSRGRCVNRKAITAGDKELRENPRSHSAKLRIFEKI
ncbi:MAG: 16S rRNA (cytosine(1402)-N(4))-methyltransferase RsmH [Lachnospiraceae bacterium]|nr:16S rRNA (cytosine(1402)-N(4))-methyltransferase RsmH [Lachnospiraceae bacterium]